MRKIVILGLLAACGASGVCAQSGGASVWDALSAPAMDTTKAAVVENVQIVRDRVKITLINGTIQFTQPANGVVFGAVFRGSGRVQIVPPNPIEAQQLRLLANQDTLDMTFSEATFSFTDGLLEEVGKQVKWKEGPAGDDLYAKRQEEREDVGGEYLPRLYKSVMSPDRKRTAYFLADLKTNEKPWVEVRYDAMQPEEVRVGHWGEMGAYKHLDYWMNFPAEDRDPRFVYDDPESRQDYLIPDYQIDANAEESAEMSATARVTVQPRYSGERVLVFTLDSNLHLATVKDAQGRTLEFHQARERKLRSQSHGNYVAVMLQEPTQAGQKQAIEFQYGGKHIVEKVGEGNYYCESFGWYPALFEPELGIDVFAFRSNFDLTFHIPKKFKLVATGTKTSEKTEGKELVSTWKSDIPLAAAGFSFGNYKVFTDKVGDIDVQIYANDEPDANQKNIQMDVNNDLGQLNDGRYASRTTYATVGVLVPSAYGKKMTSEMVNTLKDFQAYFGPYPYKTLSVTSISGGYGQGWPGLLYLSWITFLDKGQQDTLGITDKSQASDRFRAHESSHQWWGHRVGWKSYHDQWLSEGFAEFSGLLYVQFAENMKEDLIQFRLAKEHLTHEDRYRHRVDTLGPIWMGQRIYSSATDDWTYQSLVYLKGAYVLQMIRQMMTDPRSPDPEHIFKDTMQDYCKTYENKAASTEDFKAIVEKHMTPGMDLDGNHKMDWFFGQYVYGMGMPTYSLHVNLTPTADGKTSVSGELLRTGVPDNWKDVIPIYAHMGDKIMRLGTIPSVQPRVTLNFVLPAKVDRLTIDDLEDDFADVKQ